MWTCIPSRNPSQAETVGAQGSRRPAKRKNRGTILSVDQTGGSSPLFGKMLKIIAYYNAQLDIQYLSLLLELPCEFLYLKGIESNVIFLSFFLPINLLKSTIIIVLTKILWEHSRWS